MTNGNKSIDHSKKKKPEINEYLEQIGHPLYHIYIYMGILVSNSWLNETLMAFVVKFYNASTRISNM